MANAVRVRFAPSPTGYLHVGGARTVLFNWLFARQTGGRFILRIEDTDQTRHVADSVAKIVDDLRWLGFDWDEGPDVGGDCGPYFQSQRLDLYNRYVNQLLESGAAYYALETPEELAAMRRAAEKKTGGFRYPRPDPLPTIEQGEAARAQGRPVVVRFKMPDEAITIRDEILGQVSLGADQHEDFVIVKSDGFPTYHLACVVDDELMQITHVLRGQEHLMNTPKHVAMQHAFGFATPRYAHLPVIFNMDGSKMSKRDKEKALSRGESPPEIDVHDFRVAGYLPEALVNFIALLGWNPGDPREYFTLDELISAFSLERIGKTNARFDRQKLLAFNTAWASRLPEERLLEAFRDYLAVQATERQRDEGTEGRSDEATKRRSDEHGDGASDEAAKNKVTQPGLVHQPTDRPPTDEDLRAILRACAGFRTFADLVDVRKPGRPIGKAVSLFIRGHEIQYDPEAVQKVLEKNEGAGYAMLEYMLPRLETLADWTPEALESLMKTTCREKDCGMGSVAQPIRVAVTGSTISPSIQELLFLHGKEDTIARIRKCLEERKE